MLIDLDRLINKSVHSLIFRLEDAKRLNFCLNKKVISISLMVQQSQSSMKRKLNSMRDIIEDSSPRENQNRLSSYQIHSLEDQKESSGIRNSMTNTLSMFGTEWKRRRRNDSLVLDLAEIWTRKVFKEEIALVREFILEKNSRTTFMRISRGINILTLTIILTKSQRSKLQILLYINRIRVKGY